MKGMLVIAAGLVGAGVVGSSWIAQAAQTTVGIVKREPSVDLLAKLNLAPGFEVDIFAKDLVDPCLLAVAPSGDVYVTRRSVGDVILLRDADGDGKAEIRRTVASRPDMQGIAIDGETMYLATANEVYRTSIKKDGTLGELAPVIDDFPAPGEHVDRKITMAPGEMTRVENSGKARLAGLAFAKDGSLLLADDLGGMIYRISYDPPSADKQSTAEGLAKDILGKDAKGVSLESAVITKGKIPLRYSGDGKDISPPLSWSDPPEGTKSLAIFVEVADARTEKPYVHWIIANMPPATRALAEAKPSQPKLEIPKGAIQGRNSAGSVGYTGSKPPVGDHRYHFQLFALDTMLDVAPGADRNSFLEAMEGHVLGVGSFMAAFDTRKGVAAESRPLPDLKERTKAVRQRARTPSRNTLVRKPRD